MTSDADQWRHHGSPAGPATLEEVAGLRWREPRRAAELAQQVLADAAACGEAGTWLRAAGWLLCGRSAVGDAREIALELLADVDTRAGRDVLRRPEAGRLRVELAALAQSNGDPDVARDLLDGWQVAGPDAGAERDELELDRLAVLVRCALVDGADLSELRADVEELSRRLSGPPEALAELLLGSVHRDDGEPAAAAERALRGLARLGWTPAEPSSPPSSPHLGCALLSQWATALLEDGASADIPDGVKQLDVVDGGRHGVLWRLAVARAFAGRARPTADVLEDAASAAAAVDAPSLEAACRSAQAELFEGAGRFQDALAAVKAAMEAERTDRERAERLREALAGPAASLVDDLDLATGADPGADLGADLDVSRSGAALPDRFDALSGPVDGPAPTADVSDRAEPSPAPEGAALDGGAAGDTGSAGPAMATLDLGLDAAGETSSVPAETNGHPGPDGPASAASTTSRGHVLDGGLTADPVDARRDRGGAEAAEPIPGGPGSGAFGATGAAGGDERRNGSGPFRTDGPDARADGARAADVPTTADTGRSDDTGAAGPGRVEPALPGPDVPWQLPGSRGADAASGNGEGSPLAEALLAELRGEVRDVPRPTPAESDPPPSTGEAESRGPVSGNDGGPTAQRPTIVLELVGSDGRPLRHRDSGDVGADLAARVERLVPADAEVRGPDDGPDRIVADSAVEVSVPGAEGVALQLWARSLLSHLAGRVARRDLPEGTLLRAGVHGGAGSAGDVQERPLSGPTTADEDATRAAASAGSETDPRLNGASVDHLRGGAAAEADGRHGAGEDSSGAPVARPGRRRRAEDADGAVPAAGAQGASAAINGRGRPQPHDAGGEGEPDASTSTDGGPSATGTADGASADGRAALNGRRRSRAEARRAATELPGGTAGAVPDRGADPWSVRRPDPLDTSVPVEDVVPDGAVRLKGEWVVPGPLERAAVDSVWNGVRPFSGSDQGARLTGDRAPSADGTPSPTSDAGEDRAVQEAPVTDGVPGRFTTGGSHRAEQTSADPVPAAAADPARTTGPDGTASADDGASVDGTDNGRARSRRRTETEGSDGVEGSVASAPDTEGESRSHPAPDGAIAPAVAGGRHAAADRTVDVGPAAATGTEPGPEAGSDTGARSSAESVTGTDPATGAGSNPTPDPTPDPTDGDTPPRETSSRRGRRTRAERRSGRGGRGRDVPATGGDPTAIPDDLGLGDLLAGALAAYRDI